jgi:hypothetical protein
MWITMISQIGTEMSIVFLSLGMQSYWLMIDASMEKSSAENNF